MSAAGAPPGEAGWSERPRRVLVVLLLAGVSFALSQTLVIPALPDLARELDASPTAASWILTAFLLSASVATPIVGKLGDVHGKGRVLTAVMLLFTVGAVVNALATSVEVLIAGRVLQGVAGGVFPLAFGIVRDTFPPREVPGALGTVSAIFGIGGGIGLPLSGVIVDNVAIEWLFWSGPLVALPAAVAAHRMIPPSPTATGLPVDWRGAALLSAALAAVLLGVSEADDWGWGSPANLGTIAAGLALGAAFVAVEARVAEPLIDLRVLRRPAVAATNLTGACIGVAMFASFLLIPQYAQAPERTGYGFGASVTVAGLLLVPAALTQLAAGPFAGRLGTRIGHRTVLATGALLTSAAFVWLTLAHGREWEFLICSALLGAGISFAFAAMANLIVGAVPQADVGIATGINTVMRTMGGSFGSAIATAILAGSVAADRGLPTEGAYTAAFAFSAAAGLLAFVAALLVPRQPAALGSPAGVARRGGHALEHPADAR